MKFQALFCIAFIFCLSKGCKVNLTLQSTVGFFYIGALFYSLHIYQPTIDSYFVEDPINSCVNSFISTVLLLIFATLHILYQYFLEAHCISQHLMSSYLWCSLCSFLLGFFHQKANRIVILWPKILYLPKYCEDHLPSSYECCSKAGILRDKSK